MRMLKIIATMMEVYCTPVISVTLSVFPVMTKCSQVGGLYEDSRIQICYAVDYQTYTIHKHLPARLLFFDCSTVKMKAVRSFGMQGTLPTVTASYLRRLESSSTPL